MLDIVRISRIFTYRKTLKQKKQDDLFKRNQHQRRNRN